MPSAARMAAVVSALLAALLLPSAASADTYDVTSANDAGTGSLRQAITDANAHANSGGADRIRTTLASGSGVSLASALPAITETVDLDLSGAVIDVNGFDAPAGGGLHLSGAGADDSIVARFGLTGFAGRGIFVDSSDVDVTGVAVDGNGVGDAGIGVAGQRAEIRDSVVRDTGNGVEIAAPFVTLANSTVAGNSAHGVLVDGAFASIVVGNRVEGNGGDGIRIANGLGNIIGQTDGTQTGNRIEGNAGYGVNVVDGIQNVVGINVIRGNALGTINLGAPGLEENDPGDGDNGPNFLQNFPLLSSVRTDAVAGSLNTNANTDALLQFYADPAGGHELTTYLGSLAGRTDGAGDLPFTHVPGVPLEPGWGVSAFATTQDGSGPPFTLVFPAQRGGPPADPGPVIELDPGAIDAGLKLFDAITQRRLSLQPLSLTLSGRNLRTWTDYKGLDPELAVPGTTMQLREDVFTRNRGFTAFFDRARVIEFPPRFEFRAKAPKFVRTTRTFTSFPAGRSISMGYEITRKRGRKLPKALRVKVRQRFTLARPGFESLTVKRTRRVLVRRARR